MKKTLLQSISGWAMPAIFAGVFGLISCQKPATETAGKPTAADSLLHREWHPENHKMVAQATALLRSGDILLRTGADATSHSLRSMNQKNQAFSHCGIVSIENDTPWVYHSIGGEDNPDARIRRETATQFLNPLSNEGGGICRYELPDEVQHRILAQAKEWQREGRRFDLDFDLTTDSAMYCAEYVYKCFKNAGADSSLFSKSAIGGFEYVAVDDLYSNPKAKIIYKFVYQ